MEHRSKRRRTWKEFVGLTGSPERSTLPAMVELNPNHENIAMALAPSVTGYTVGGSSHEPSTLLVQRLYLDIPLSPPEPTPVPTRLYRRRDEIPAVQTIVESIVDVVLESGTSKVGEIQLTGVPTAPTVISIPSFGPFTVPVFPTATPQIVSTNPVVPIDSSSSSSTNIQVPGSSSQMVISSPPPTPLPSTSAMTLPTTLSAASNSTLAATVKPTGNLTTTSK